MADNFNVQVSDPSEQSSDNEEMYGGRLFKRIFILCDEQPQKALTHRQLARLGRRVQKDVELRAHHNEDTMGQLLLTIFLGLLTEENLIR